MAQKLRHSVSDSENSMIENFRMLSHQVVGFGKTLSVQIIPYTHPRLPLFSSLPMTQKKIVLQALNSYVKICHECLSAGGDLADSGTLIWCAFKEYGFKPKSSDFFSYLSNDQVIEIYNLQHVQIFRNFNFFEFVSYSLEDLFCRPWFDLFNRPDAQIPQAMQKSLEQALQQPQQVLKTGIPVHQVDEIDSLFRFKSLVNVSYIAALADATSNVAAFIALEKVELIYKPSFEEREAMLQSVQSACPVEEPQLDQLNVIQLFRETT